MAEELSFKDKIKTLQFATGATRNNVKESRDPVDGHRIKKTRDDATSRGNITIEHNNKEDRVDVNIRPDTIVYEL